jgi:hypothetical protein
MNLPALALPAPAKSIQVRVVEPGCRASEGWTPCEIGTNIEFKAELLATYFFKGWSPLLEDALLVAGAVEFCDMSLQRPSRTWARDIHLRVPVHELARWQDPSVANALHDALNYLTGDRWSFSFIRREDSAFPRGQQHLELDHAAEAVIPFSNGLDSCSVADLESRKLGPALIRIRLGTHDRDMRRKERRSEKFAKVPYSVKGDHKESSMRSRGFKFGMVSGLAAYLADAPRVIMPESGQGAIGPAIAPLGQVYADYRTHPTFLRKLETFLEALLGRRITYELPRIWNTKGETLAAHLKDCAGDVTAWQRTLSCWQQNRHAGVNHRLRQCGICAACLLRRMSVHAANLTEADDTYVWEDLSAPTLEGGASPDFDRAKITGKMREYAIAGTLHLDHLAGFRNSPTTQSELNLHIFLLSRACGQPTKEIRDKVDQLLGRHEVEWRAFLASLGPRSFLREWAS